MAEQGLSRNATLWQTTAAPAPATAALKDMKSADVAVIGGGYTGLSTALHLAQRKISVVLLEADEIGAGASGVNTGWWGPTWSMVSPDVLTRRYDAAVTDHLMATMVFGSRYISDLIRRYDISCDHNPKGLLFTAAREKTFDKLVREAKQWRDAGASVSILNQTEQRNVLNTDYYLGAVHYHDGGTLNPLGFAHGLARAAMREGALIHTQSPVIAMMATDYGWQLKTPDGEVNARRVVIATGASMKTPWRPLRQAAYKLRIAMIASAPFPDRGVSIAIGKIPFADMDSNDTFGGAFDPGGHLIMSILPGFPASPTPDELAAPFWRKFKSVFPQAPDAIKWDYGWFGEEAVPGDRFTKLYNPAENLFILQGYAGNGISQSIVFGKKLAGHIASNGGQPLPLPIAKLAPVFLPNLLSGLINRIAMPIGRSIVYR